MRILHLSGARSWGGNEQQLVDGIFGLDKLNVENHILCVSGHPLEKYAIDNRLNHLAVKVKKASKKPYILALCKVVKDLKIDLIHLHTSDVVTSFVLARLFYGLKIDAVFSKKGIGNSYSILSKFKYNYKGIKKIICVSDAVLQAFKKQVIYPKNHSKLQVVYDGLKIERATEINTINLKTKFNLPSETILLGNIANHAKAKDLPTLIRAINHMVNVLKVTNIHLIQIGSSSKYTEEIKALIQEFKLESYISLAGFMNSPMSLLKQINIYMMSSEREGLPITIYEAFHQKTPVISTKAGGIPEAISDGINGYLAEVRDYKTLAKKTKELIENPIIQEEFIDKSYNLLMQKFTTKQLAKQTKEVYLEVLKNDL